jgi:hypothetical protein
MKYFALAFFELLLLSGCVDTIHELKSDPAIVGITGFWFQAGVDASASTGGVPLPNIKFGHGTIWRVGTSDKVTIEVGDTVNNPTNNTTNGQSSLKITTEGTSKTLKEQK